MFLLHFNIAIYIGKTLGAKTQITSLLDFNIAIYIGKTSFIKKTFFITFILIQQSISVKQNPLY